MFANRTDSCSPGKQLLSQSFSNWCSRTAAAMLRARRRWQFPLAKSLYGSVGPQAGSTPVLLEGSSELAQGQVCVDFHFFFTVFQHKLIALVRKEAVLSIRPLGLVSAFAEFQC